MSDLKHQMQDNFLKYASYVILDRAIPNVVDGLKPVQRRILHTLYSMDDGKLHKVANVCGQTMAYHPHGDAPIQDALVNLANKNFLLDRQGNFGNLFTGDPASAARYIETRLSPLARETLFNPDLTPTIPSYDSRHQEPVILPAKIPILLMQGAEGIAVGMSTRILPHNFAELLQAEIDILEGKEIHLLPDFLTGGIMDPSQYDAGRGKIKLRAALSTLDDKTLLINEICWGTTTESLIRSIDEAAKKGKIKIDSIQDFTAERVEIQIKLPRGQHADHVIDALYAFTECEVTLHSQILVIKDNLPVETDVHEVLRWHTADVKKYLQKELEIERGRLLEKIYQKTLEQIFIENRLYKKIEPITVQKEIQPTLEKSLTPYHSSLPRKPGQGDFERLLAIPIRRISLFDINKHHEEIQLMEKQLQQIEGNLKQMKKFTIRYIKGLLDKYGKDSPRRTEIQTIEEVDKRAVATKKIKVGIDTVNGFVGTRVNGDVAIECTNFDKLLILSRDGAYKVINISEKEYVYPKLLFVGVADKKKVMNCVYYDPKNHFPYGKRFIVEQFILDKEYRFIEVGMHLEYFSPEEPPGVVTLEFKPKPRQKLRNQVIDLQQLPIKKVSNKGIRLASKPVKKITSRTKKK